MYKTFLVIFITIAIVLIILILLQQGRGIDMGASFGTGASGTLFGSSGPGNFITRMITVLAMLFFISSLILANINGKKNNKRSDNLTTSVKTKKTKPIPITKMVDSDIPQ